MNYSFQLQLNSIIVPTKVLTDPQELDRALTSGFQTANGFAFDPASGIVPEAYQVINRNFRSGSKRQSNRISVIIPSFLQSLMDVLPAEMPQMMGGYTAAETMVVPTIITGTIHIYYQCCQL